MSQAMKDADCTKEQMITYNFLFRDAHINGMPKEKIVQSVERFYGDQLRKKKIDVKIVEQLIELNYESYMEKPFIAGSYHTVAENIKKS